MAAFPCPFCAHALVASDGEDKLEQCPSCAGNLLIAYRYRLVASAGSISGGELYEAIDDGFRERVAVLFVSDPADPAAVERFVTGSDLFAHLGGRGIVKLRDVGSSRDRRAHVVMDWLDGGTLDVVVRREGVIEQATLLPLVEDLLIGLSKAHRSMPATVHGHIHPGKIGFNRHGKAVLFGFDWATQSNAQDSHLADSLIAESKPDESRDRNSDLRQLALSLFYAATGDWLADAQLADQREQALARLPGPLGVLIDRMLGAGLDGYESAVEASIDFERLMRGNDGWESRRVSVRDRSKERMGTAFARPGKLEADADYGNDEDDEFETAYPAPNAPREPSELARRSPSSSAADADWRVRVAQRQAAALAVVAASKPASTTKSARSVSIAVAGMILLGIFGAGMIALGGSDEKHSVSAPRFEPEPIPRVAAKPEPIPRIAAQPIPLPPKLEPPAASSVSSLFRYTGRITGPADFAGLGLGEACEIWIKPNPGKLNCRWYIDCGAPRRRIYGGGNIGFSTCSVDADGRPLRAQDGDDDAPDGAFVANFESQSRSILVEDRWMLPPVRVIISVDAGGAHSGPIPEVVAAPRLSSAVIDQRTARGEFPIVKPGLIGDW